MAIVNLNEVAEMVRPYLKADTYTVRVVDADYRMSSNNNPMLVLTWEIVNPTTTEDEDKGTIKIAGLQFREFKPLIDSMMHRIKALHRALSLPMEDFDTENPDLDSYKGKAAYVNIATDVRERQNSDGTPMVNPRTGDPVITYNYNVKEVIDGAPEENIASV